MATRTIEVVSLTQASPEQVWELLSDVSTWSRWGLWEESRLEQPGPDEPQGVGARRYMHADRMKSTDEVYEFEPPSRLAYYQVESNLPARDYRSDVHLVPILEGGTEIHWRASYEAKIPGTGWMIDRTFKIFLADAARRLGRAAAGRPAETDD